MAPPPQRQQQFVAVLQAPQGGGNGWVVEVRVDAAGQGRLRLRRSCRPRRRRRARTLQFWTKAPAPPAPAPWAWCAPRMPAASSSCRSAPARPAPQTALRITLEPRAARRSTADRADPLYIGRAVPDLPLMKVKHSCIVAFASSSVRLSRGISPLIPAFIGEARAAWCDRPTRPVLAICMNPLATPTARHARAAWAPSSDPPPPPSFGKTVPEPGGRRSFPISRCHRPGTHRVGLRPCPLPRLDPSPIEELPQPAP